MQAYKTHLLDLAFPECPGKCEKEMGVSSRESNSCIHVVAVTQALLLVSYAIVVNTSGDICIFIVSQA